jgi:demethylmenaquinone methyltransferase/2-methoxy-6-polyprenyl-1,4-benzoquinol methylase
VTVSAGDQSALPFAGAALDAVTAGYALRNTPDWRASVAELARVIRPGGHLFTLDFYLPPSPAWRATFLGWLSVAGNTVGWWWHREPMAYGYIARSIAHFTTAGDFSATLEGSGFVSHRLRLAGRIALHHAIRRRRLARSGGAPVHLIDVDPEDHVTARGGVIGHEGGGNQSSQGFNG